MDAMAGFSQVVLIEGDCPIDCVDLAVFVAPVPGRGAAFLAVAANLSGPKDAGTRKGLARVRRALRRLE